ncbi:MAG: uroporphyrinogen-III synthase [Pseudomonadota bacterium]
MKPCVWITRPEGQNRVTAKKLERMGFAPLLTPLLSVVPLPLPPLPDQPFDGIILTSAHAVTALTTWAATRRDLPTLPILTTGKATATAAQKAGFENVHAFQGDAPHVLGSARSVLGPAAGALIYPCAAQTAHDLPTLAQQHGFTCTALPVYATHPIHALSAEMQSRWDAGDIGAVLLYSPRTARAFAQLIDQPPARPPVLACLSPTIAKALPAPWQTHAVWPDTPCEEVLLQRLKVALN